MAKSLLRSVTDQIMGSNNKTTDIQIIQAIRRFDDEHEILCRFKREFDKYIQAKLLFNNASNRFFDFMSSLNDSSTWPQQQSLVETYNRMNQTSTEHIQQLNEQITLSINTSTNSFKAMQKRIDGQNRVQHEYDKTRRNYQASIKRDEQAKVDRIKNELDQLKSALNLVNNELRDELPKFHRDLHKQFIDNIKDIFKMHGKYYKKTYKSFSNFNKNVHDDLSTSVNTNGNDSKLETRSSITDCNTRRLYSIPLSGSKRTDYKVLHRARVIHDYKAENEDELNLIKDELIAVISFDNKEDNMRDKGWEFAEKSDGTIGIFPVNFATRLYYNEEGE